MVFGLMADLVISPTVLCNLFMEYYRGWQMLRQRSDTALNSIRKN